MEYASAPTSEERREHIGAERATRTPKSLKDTQPDTETPRLGVCSAQSASRHWANDALRIALHWLFQTKKREFVVCPTLSILPAQMSASQVTPEESHWLTDSLEERPVSGTQEARQAASRGAASRGAASCGAASRGAAPICAGVGLNVGGHHPECHGQAQTQIPHFRTH